MLHYEYVAPRGPAFVEKRIVFGFYMDPDSHRRNVVALLRIASSATSPHHFSSSAAVSSRCEHVANTGWSHSRMLDMKPLRKP